MVDGKRTKTENTRLSASSPDEQALVAGAKGMGFDFTGDSTEGGVFRTVRNGPPQLNGETVDVADTSEKKYTLLDVLEFTSKRKRMSVIVLENGEAVSAGREEPRIRIYTKGADNVIMERLRQGQDPEMVKKTLDHLAMYADDGLRTLAIATATITKERYNAWKTKFNEALLDEAEETKRKAQMPNKIDLVMAEIETELELIGATAIEDKLQNGVPDAVASLAKAGIKIWVLTGDKQETAINIGFATQLLRRDMDRTILNGLNGDGKLKTPAALVDEIDATLRKLDEKRKTAANMPVQAVIIDGKALDIVFDSVPAQAATLQARLLNLVRQCGAVVACRVSPLQKAQMVNMVKKNEKGVKTLSIGDGANDVPMIQMAHVGVGISGQEGMQAVNASDYAVGQFRFLTRLLLVHGRWNYRRMALLVCYMFYKNVILCLVPWFYFLWVEFSSTEGGSLMIVGRTPFNVAYTGFPILLLGVYDRDVSQWMAQRYPRLYRSGHKGELFNSKVILVWIGYAVYHSFVAFYASFYMAPEGGHTSTMGIAEFGFYSMYFTIIITNLKLCHSTDMWFWWISTSLVFFALFAYPLVYIIIGHPLQLSETPDAPFPMQGLQNPNFWLGFLALIFAGVIPEMVVSAFQRRFRTTFQNLCQEVERLKWYRKQQARAMLGQAEFPVHEGLNKLDADLWKSETEGIGVSDESREEHTGKAFSMDDDTSLAAGDAFRKKAFKHSKATHGLVIPGPRIKTPLM